MKVYSLRASIDDIIKHFEDEMLHESAQAMAAIQWLREMTAA